MLDTARQPDREVMGEYEVDIALGVAWLVVIARAFRVKGNRQECLDEEIRTAQADLMQAILRACADGANIEEVWSWIIEPALSRPGVTKGAAALLEDTIRAARGCLEGGRPLGIPLPAA